MSDETSKTPTGEGEPAKPEPVGDMTVEGQTEVGPHPSLTHIENLGQADLPAVAEDNAEGKSSQDE